MRHQVCKEEAASVLGAFSSGKIQCISAEVFDSGVNILHSQHCLPGTHTVILPLLWQSKSGEELNI